jgi:uncharacterized protein
MPATRAQQVAAAVRQQATLMIKPVGAACNLRCSYCYYLPVADGVYDGKLRRMGETELDTLFAGYIPEAPDAVTIAWQGGEPTLAGLAFFQKAVELQKQHARPGQRVANALQTNGTTLTDDWCRFLRREKFLLGISIDGGPEHHQHRTDPAGRPTRDRVIAGLKLLRHHGVEHNVLTVLHRHNTPHPDAVWQQLRALGVDWLQFIPAIEWEDDPAPGREGEFRLTGLSPRPADVGRFWNHVFDRWFETCRDKVSVRLFDSVLQTLLTGRAGECTHGPRCTTQLTIEHNGDVFGCDHFVQPQWQLGSLSPAACGLAQTAQPLTINANPLDRETPALAADRQPWLDTLDYDKLGDFADQKSNLPESCEQCKYRPLCHGGCPKHRPHRGAVAEPTTLCEAYRSFYDHALPRLEWLAGYLAAGTQPPPPDRSPRHGRPAVKPKHRRRGRPHATRRG